VADWGSLLRRPDELTDGPGTEAWFGQIAARLLNGCRLIVGETPHRFVEVEAYYNTPVHPDPFAHCDPVQKHGGRWYFHRTGGIYRSGSFKGVDLAFGDASAFGGFLIRGIEAEGGPYIDGPSLTVDHLLETSGKRDVATLDAGVGERVAWDEDNPLQLEWTKELAPRTVYRAPRVGLSLKRAKMPCLHPKYIMRPYRYFTEPRKTAKGKPHMVLGMHAAGLTPDEIHELTGCPRASVKRYIADHEAGKKLTDLKPFFGVDLGTSELCKLHGACNAPKK
jgi:hypothetical protein